MFRKQQRKSQEKSESSSIEELKHPQRHYSIADTTGTFFSRKTHDCGALVNQPNIVVNVNIDQGGSDLLDCLKSCFGCVGTAAKGAGGA